MPNSCMFKPGFFEPKPALDMCWNRYPSRQCATKSQFKVTRLIN